MTEISNPPSRWQHRFRLAWYPAAGTALLILLASLPGYYLANPLGIFEGRLILNLNATTLVIFRAISLLSFATALLAIGLAILIFIKRSNERIGLFLAYYLLFYGSIFAGPIEQLQLFWPSAAWVSSFILSPVLIGPLTTALIGMFPSGRFVPTWIKWLIPASGLVLMISFLGGDDFFNLDGQLSRSALVISGIGISIGLAITQVYAQVYRYRNISSTVERQQAKIVLYGVIVWFILMALSSTAWIWGFNQPPGTEVPRWFPISVVVWVVSTLILPASLTVSVLRYRLFEIDILVNRTLVYGLLTGLLALVYFFLVTVLQNLLSAITGQQSALAIVISTLVIAALFNPFRRRIQDFIDLRFYRRRYNAEKLLTAFNVAVRDEVDLERLAAALLATVDESMQPKNASVWLRERS